PLGRQRGRVEVDAGDGVDRDFHWRRPSLFYAPIRDKNPPFSLVLNSVRRSLSGEVGAAKGYTVAFKLRGSSEGFCFVRPSVYVMSFAQGFLLVSSLKVPATTTLPARQRRQGSHVAPLCRVGGADVEDLPRTNL